MTCPNTEKPEQRKMISNREWVRCAPMNSANYKTVRSALDYLPRYGLRESIRAANRGSETSGFGPVPASGTNPPS
jgi:hypothetical protein